MSSFQHDGFHQSWKRQKTLMVERHDDERMHYKREREDKENSVIENAQRQLRTLHNTVAPADVHKETLRIQQDRDAKLLAIKKDYEEHARLIKEIQRKEKMAQERSYHDAIAARLFTDGSPTVHEAATVDTHGDMGVVIGSRSLSAPSDDRMLSAQDAISIAANSRQQDQPARSGQAFSCTVQREFTSGKEQYVLRYKTKNRKASQETTESHVKKLYIDTSVNPFPTPTPTVSAVDDLPPNSKTITFDEVYQNGQAKHKDTIIESPPNSRQWYILKCEAHHLRFNQRPLQGAAKHLTGRLHGHPVRDRNVALEMFGYRVIDCNEQLAELNNQAVDNAYANGYKLTKLLSSEKKAGRNTAVVKPKEPRMVGDAAQKGKGNSSQGAGVLSGSERKSAASPTKRRRKSSSSSAPKCTKMSQENLDDIITSPKPFHVYYGYWKPENSIWPVMILGWDDQTAGGLKDDLVGTGLLNKKVSNPPKCYVYKDNTMNNAMDNAIVGWAPGFEDGGPKVTQRKFPVMFFDSDQSVSWVSARSLSRFPLYDSPPSNEYDHPFNAARRWIAKKDGFASWEEFERVRHTRCVGTVVDCNKQGAHEVREKGETSNPPTTPHQLASPIIHRDTPGSDWDAESTSPSVATNVTEKELLEMLDQAGEIPDDADYVESDIDSCLGDEYEAWTGDIEASNSRPWAFYGLRNTENTETRKCRPSGPARSTRFKDTEATTSVHKGMKSARTLASHARAQEESSSAKAGYDLEMADASPKGADKAASQSDDDKDPSSISSTDPCDVSSAKTILQPGQTGPLVHTAEVLSGSGVEEDTSFIQCTSRIVSSELLTHQAKDTSQGVKRVRSGDEAKTDISAVGQGPAKKAKTDIQPRLPGESGILDAEDKNLDETETTTADAASIISSHKQVPTTSAALDRESTPASPILPTFIPKVPFEPAAYELSSYSMGSVSWHRGGSEPCVSLYYGKDDNMLGTIDGPLRIVIDPTTFKGLKREEIPGSKGNSMMTLVGKDEGDASMRLVFDRTEESKVNIGRVQVRSFLRWVRTVNTEIRVLDS